MEDAVCGIHEFVVLNTNNRDISLISIQNWIEGCAGHSPNHQLYQYHQDITGKLYTI